MTVCRPHITDAGLPCRGPLLLARDRGLYPDMVAALQGPGRGRGERREPAEATVEAVAGALASPEPAVARAGAFVAGRSRAEDDDADRHLTELVTDLVQRSDPARLRSDALPYVEAAMAVALRGDAAVARRALLPLVEPEGHRSMADWLAAFYLAQMGDPSGWPVLLDLLEGTDGFSRLMAARHLVGFVPFDGQVVDGRPVDVVARLAERLDDGDELVAVEVPGLLLELGDPRAGDLVAAAAAGARHRAVRDAARAALGPVDGAGI